MFVDPFSYSGRHHVRKYVTEILQEMEMKLNSNMNSCLDLLKNMIIGFSLSVLQMTQARHKDNIKCKHKYQI
jgi:hypothetical protein